MDDPMATFKDDVGAVRSAIRQETENGRDVIVIAHSYGGTVGNSAVKGFSKPTFVREESSASSQSSISTATSSKRIPETGHVIGLVLIATGFCFTGLTFMDHFLNITPPFFRVNKETGFADLAVRPQKFFYHDLPPAEADHATSMLTTQSLRALFEGRAANRRAKSSDWDGEDVGWSRGLYRAEDKPFAILKPANAGCADNASGF
ncbi:hypothetical protein FOBRF1_010959 [Fusarium oxysporum]